MWTLLTIWWTGVKDGLQSPLELSSGMTYEEEQSYNEAYDRGVNFGQRVTNLFCGRGFRTDWQLEKPYNWTRYQNFLFGFIALNILTFPLSPVGGGIMSRSAYMPIMWAKAIIVALLLLFGVYMWISSKVCKRYVA